MFVISVENIKVAAFIGVYEVEKKEANTFSIDVFVETDFPIAMQNDNLEDALDYAIIYEIVLAQMQIPCDLLEKKVNQIVTALFIRCKQASVIEIKIRKHKPLNMSLCDFATITCRFERSSFPFLGSL